MKAWLAYPCKEDWIVFLISRVDSQIGILPAQASCPKCGSPMLVCEDYPEGLIPKIISAVEFFQAVNGLGLPNDQDASKSKVIFSILNGTIKWAELEEATSNRTIIQSIDVKVDSDGITRRLHFASSTKGATIYKIEVLPC